MSIWSAIWGWITLIVGGVIFIVMVLGAITIIAIVGALLAAIGYGLLSLFHVS